MLTSAHINTQGISTCVHRTCCCDIRAMAVLFVALVHSRQDYGNSVLVCMPAYLVRRLQSLTNAATPLIFHLKCCQAGPFSWEHPIALSFYIFITWSVRPARSVAPAATLLSAGSQSVRSRWSRVKQSSRRRARSRTRRWSIVAVINKMINFNYEFIMFT